MFLFENKKVQPKPEYNMKISIDLDRFFSFLIVLIVFIVTVFCLGYSAGFKKAIFLTNLKQPVLKKISFEKKVTKKIVKSKEFQKEIVKDTPKIEKKEEFKYRYTVQLATYTYKNKEIAQEYLKKLRERGINAFIIHSKDYIVLCAGEFKDRKEGEILLSKLREEFKDSFIRRYIR